MLGYGRRNLNPKERLTKICLGVTLKALNTSDLCSSADRQESLRLIKWETSEVYTEIIQTVFQTIICPLQAIHHLKTEDLKAIERDNTMTSKHVRLDI